jgi:hypothetical protein
MKIIVLEGPNHRGKTTTLGMVFAAIITNGAVVQKFAILPSIQDKDFKTTLAYQGNKVAIYSQGDTQRNCYEIIDRYSSSVDILILAHSSLHRPLSIDTTIYTKYVVNKTIACSSVSVLEANARDCRSIVRLI